MSSETPSTSLGVKILHDPMRNKGTAFTERERDALKLRGLLPPRVCSQEEQSLRVLGNMRGKANDLERYLYLIGLQDRNERLFYRVVMDNIEEIMPLIYTPVVGQACQAFGQLFRRPRGIYISLEDRGRVRELLSNWPLPKVTVIVVTDGERILGLGDLGADGMGIPIGKLSLYSACAGIDPAHCLPVTLDAGTNNERLLSDPLYLGLQRRRESGAEYDELVEEFITAAQEMFPRVLIQLEDFGNRNAFRLLERYRHTTCLFDDDIQGTAAVALAGIYASLRLTGGKLTDQLFLFHGAGEAGLGIGELLTSALMVEGMSLEEARERSWFVDSKGLIVKSRDNLTETKRIFAHEHEAVPTTFEAIEALRPTALIGVSGQPQAFTEEMVRAMSRHNEKPIIFALSNPTSKAECTAEQAYRWSDCRAIYASGSPFPDVELDGHEFSPGQGNNAYVFPGVGLGVIAAQASEVTDEMFFAAAEVLADQVTEEDLERGRIYPALSTIRDVSEKIAVAVVEKAYEQGLAQAPRSTSPMEQVRLHIFDPCYDVKE